MKTKTISKLLFASAVFLLLPISQITYAAGSDSSMIRPGAGPTVGSLQPASGRKFSPAVAVPTTVIEYTFGTCPAGFTGPSGNSQFRIAQRTNTTYYLDGKVVGNEIGAWTDVDDDCTQKETRTLACPPNQRGIHTQERDVATATGGYQYSAWRDVSNTCAYYFLSNGTEYNYPSCPAGQVGNITHQRTYQKWSDGSIRNYSAWTESSRNCVSRAMGPVDQVIAKVKSTGYLSGFKGTQLTGNLRNQMSFSGGHGSAYGVTIDRSSAQLQCLASTDWGDEPSFEILLPKGQSITHKWEVGSCKLSNGNKTANIYGNCDSMSGGDNDACQGKKLTVTITSESTCSVTTVTTQNGWPIAYGTANTFNICN